MKTLIPTSLLFGITLGLQILAAGEQQMSPEELEKQSIELLRTEISKGERLELEEPWSDQSKWELTDYYPPRELVRNAYELLKKSGHSDLGETGALYYSVAEGKHLLLITSTNANYTLGKYYCLAYDSEGETPLKPVKVWALYSELVPQITHLKVDTTSKPTESTGEVNEDSLLQN